MIPFRRLLFALLSSGTVFGLGSCAIDDAGTAKYGYIPTGYSNVFEYLDDLQPRETKAVINNSTGGYVRGDKGTFLRIPAGSFEYADGTPLGGNVEFSLYENLSLVDQFFAAPGGLSSSGFLASGGIIRIAARQNSFDVRLTSSARIAAYVPVNERPVSGLTLNIGADMFVPVNKVQWSPASFSTVNIQDTLGGQKYRITLDRLGWYNMASSLPGGQVVNVNLPAGYDVNNTQVFLINNDNGQVWSTALAPGSPYPFSSGIFSLQAGSRFRVLAVSVSGGYMRYHMKDITSFTGEVIEIPYMESIQDCRLQTKIEEW